VENENLFPENTGDYGIPVPVPAEHNVQEIVAEAQAPEEATVDNMATVQEQNDREMNFARLREERARAEYERDEAINYIKQMQQQQQAPESDDINWDSEDLVEAKHVGKKIKQLENKLRSYEQQTAYHATEARIKSTYSDFDKVVTKENIDALRTQHPEIAQALHATPDIYNKAVSTYNIIKKFGLNQSPQNLLDKATVARNNFKPKATNSISPQQGDSPLAKANDFANGFLTEDRKAQLWQEIQAARNAS